MHLSFIFVQTFDDNPLHIHIYIYIYEEVIFLVYWLCIFVKIYISIKSKKNSPLRFFFLSKINKRWRCISFKILAFPKSRTYLYQIHVYNSTIINEIVFASWLTYEIWERDKPWRHRSGHVKHFSMHKELTILSHSLRSQEVDHQGKSERDWNQTVLESNRWQTAPTKVIWARIEPGELRTDEGSKIQEWRLHACANCGEIWHLLDHWVRRSSNSWHSDRECQRSPQRHHRMCNFQEGPRCLAGRPTREGVMTPTGETPEPRMLRRNSSAIHEDIRANIDRERGTIGKTGRGETVDWSLRGDNQINPTTHTGRRRLWVNASCKGRRDVKMGTHGKCMVGPRPWGWDATLRTVAGNGHPRPWAMEKERPKREKSRPHRQVFSVRPSKFAKYTSTGWAGRPTQNVSTPSANCTI